MGRNEREERGKRMRQVIDKAEAERQASAGRSPSLQTAHPQATHPRTRGIKFPVSRWRWVWLGVAVCVVAAGCAEPVVFSPISDPDVETADTPPKGMVVRTFAGHTLSLSKEYHGDRSPAVATVTSGREPGRGMCRFLYFVGGVVVHLDLPIHGPLDAGKAELRGWAYDPRGWKVHWTASLDGDIIEGTFKQPNDHGTFRLREIE